MNHQISRIAVHQTAMVIGVAYALLGILFIPFFWIASVGNGDMGPVWIALLIPFGYGLLAYISTALFCAFYNLVAGWTGGIEITLSETTRGA